jgi:hypothetical protein
MVSKSWGRIIEITIMVASNKLFLFVFYSIIAFAILKSLLECHYVENTHSHKISWDLLVLRKVGPYDELLVRKLIVVGSVEWHELLRIMYYLHLHLLLRIGVQKLVGPHCLRIV